MDPRRTAHHEAGHAVAAVVLKTGLISVDIRPMPVPGGGMGLAGANLRRPPDDQVLGKGETAVMPYLVTFLAGWIAEQAIEPMAGIEADHPQSDGRMVQRYAVGAVCTPTLRDGQIVLLAEEQEAKKDHIAAVLEAAESEAREFVSRHARAIAAVASELLRRQQLSVFEVEELVRAYPPAEEGDR